MPAEIMAVMAAEVELAVPKTLEQKPGTKPSKFMSCTRERCARESSWARQSGGTAVARSCQPGPAKSKGAGASGRDWLQFYFVIPINMGDPLDETPGRFIDETPGRFWGATNTKFRIAK